MKTTGPICRFDGKECSGFDSLNETADCHKCNREYNGVRETGTMPGLGQFINWLKQKFLK